MLPAGRWGAEARWPGRAVDGSPGTRQEVGEAQGGEGPGLLPALQGDEVT